MKVRLQEVLEFPKIYYKNLEVNYEDFEGYFSCWAGIIVI